MQRSFAIEMYCYIWEYDVRPDCTDAFKKLYGPSGDWVQLFSGSPDFLQTQLLSDHNDPHRFLTIDCWKSHAACRSFRAAHSDEFEAIDAAGDRLTLQERFVGDFESQTT